MKSYIYIHIYLKIERNSRIRVDIVDQEATTTSQDISVGSWSATSDQQLVDCYDQVAEEVVKKETIEIKKKTTRQIESCHFVGLF